MYYSHKISQYPFISNYCDLVNDGKNAEIDYYICVTERESKNYLHDAAGCKFKEIIDTGVFSESLGRNYSMNVPLDFNHNDILTHEVRLEEDRIGLRMYGLISDINTIADILTNKISGTSFAFQPVKTQIIPCGDRMEYKRIVQKMNLLKVTLVSKGYKSIYGSGALQRIYIPPYLINDVYQVISDRVKNNSN